MYKKKRRPLLIKMELTNSLPRSILLFLIFMTTSQVAHTWELTRSKGVFDSELVTVTQGYNGDYILNLILACRERDSSWTQKWEIVSKPAKKSWVSLAYDSDLHYQLFVDENPHSNKRNFMTYDIGSNAAKVSGYLDDSLVNGFARGSGISIWYRFEKLVALDLKGSKDAISLAKQKCEVINREAERKKNIGVAFVIIGLLIALAFSIKLLLWMGKKLKRSSKDVSNIVKNQIDESKKRKVMEKVTESALDELVRETVRQAMKEGVDPDDIKICKSCVGKGCDLCGGRGWTRGSS